MKPIEELYPSLKGKLVVPAAHWDDPPEFEAADEKYVKHYYEDEVAVTVMDIKACLIDKATLKKKFYRLKRLLSNKRFQKIELLKNLESIEKELGL